MPRIKKERQNIGLDRVPVLIEDGSRTSPRYLNITDLGDKLSLGKNGFKIRGTERLEQGSAIEIEVLDTDGDRIYHETQDYKEGVSRVVSVYVYDDTPVGEGQIIITATANTQFDGSAVPDRWQGRTNFKWTRTLNVDPNTYNTSMIRFQREPEVEIDEETYIRKEGAFNDDTAEFERLGDPEFEPEPAPGTGDFSTWPLYTTTPGEGRETIRFEYFPPHFGHDYTVVEAKNFDWIQPMEGQEMIVDSSVLPLDQNMSLRLDRVMNDTYARFVIRTPEYKEYLQEYVVETDRIFLIYERQPLVREEKDRAYYKNVQLGFIGTFTGEVAEARVFNKIRGEQEEFEYVAEFPIKPRELFVRDNEDRVELVDEAGDFGEEQNVTDFVTSTDYNISQDNSQLLRSARLDSIPREELASIGFTPNNFEATVSFDHPDLRPFRFFEYAEYTLSFEAVLTTEVPDDAELNVLLKGDAFAGNRKLIYEKEYIDQTYMEVRPRINFFTDRTADAFDLDPGSDTEPFQIIFQAADINQNHVLNIANISLTPAQTAGFSPDYTILRVPVDTTQYGQNEIDRLKYRVDLYDTNNNRAGVRLESI